VPAASATAASAAIIAAATTPAQRVLVSTVGALAAEAQAQAFELPAIVVIGDIVSARLQWLGETSEPGS